jgi:hypothetical protein
LVFDIEPRSMPPSSACSTIPGTGDATRSARVVAPARRATRFGARARTLLEQRVQGTVRSRDV